MSDTNTTNYGFVKIDFNNRPWDGKANSNWDLLDSLLYTIFQLPNIGGVWRNSTAYTAGQNILDSSSLVFYQCVVSNTSAATGTFAAERAANPSYWTLSNSGQGSVRYDMGQALTDPQILQAQTNIALFARFLRFDAAQTLTYNNMLQVLNTLGIDGTESTIVSAATTDIGNVNTQAVAIAGTTTITSFGPRPNKYKLVRFTGSLTLTNSSALSLPAGANIVTQAGDTCVAISDGTTPTANWSVRTYSRADGTLVIGRPILTTTQSLSIAEQKAARDNINAAYGEDLKTALIQLAKVRAVAIGTPNYLSDDFIDSSGVDPASTNTTVVAGTVLNQAVDANCVALLHFNGINGATTTTDDKGNTVTLTNATLSTSQKKLGSASLQLSGTSSSAVIAASTSFDFSSGDLTLEGFFYVNTAGAGAARTILSVGNSIIYVTSNSLRAGVIGTDYITGGTVSASTWYHWALVRSGSTTTLYLNGNSVGTTTQNLFTGGSQAVYLGMTGGNANYLDGFLDETRLSKGIARYTGGFTPTTTEFSAGSSGNLNMLSIAVQAAAVPTRASMYILIKSTAGTLNVNTNFIGSISRDGGTTYTQFVLSNVGSYAGYTIYEQNVLDISGQPSAANMKYKFITNDVALGVAIDAVVAQWG